MNQGVVVANPFAAGLASPFGWPMAPLQLAGRVQSSRPALQQQGYATRLVSKVLVSPDEGKDGLQLAGQLNGTISFHQVSEAVHGAAVLGRAT